MSPALKTLLLIVGFRVTAFLLAALATGAHAAERLRYDISKAWFKPELTLNRQPDVCQPIFERYVEYFTSREARNPLRPIASRQWEEHSPGVLTEGIRELEWETFREPGSKGLRLAHWQQDGKYLGIVERSGTHGWRPPSYAYFLIDKPLSDSEAEDEAKTSYGEGSLGQFRETSTPELFDVIYDSDPRFKDYKQNTFVQVANVFSSRKGVYLALTVARYTPGPTEYIITRVVSPRQVQALCKITALPSSQAMRAEAGKIAHFSDFEKVVLDIMGGAGSCGTMNSHARAYNELREGLNTLLYRPWPHGSSTKDHDFLAWGYSGAWNYRKYQQYLALLPKARHGLAEKYARDYRLALQEALALADDGIRSVLASAFDHGRTVDPYAALHQALLEGKPVDEVPALLAQPTAIETKDKDGPLAFAVGHPHLVEYLLKQGFNPNSTNAFGKTPLIYAAQFNDLASARLLVGHGASTELATTRPMDTCSYTIETHRVTALHYAVRYASREFVEWLVRAGAVTSAKDSQDRTPLDYLTDFGGMAGYRKTAEPSYGRQNALLSPADREALAALLKPPSAASLQATSDAASREAEALYRAGKLQEAYRAAKKALSLNAANERAMANLSLIALRLGLHGESAKAATYVIGHAASENERASAYFNLGLACRAEGNRGFHYSPIYYDGTVYCQERHNQFHGPLHYFLRSFETQPSARRANAIVEFLEEPDAQRSKWLCKARGAGDEPRTVYVTTSHVYFLARTGARIEYPRFARRERNKESPLEVTKREELPLGNGLSVFRWDVYVPFQGTLVIGDQLCGRYLPSMIEDGLDLVEIFTRGEGRQVTVATHTSKPIVLVLYGDNATWGLDQGSKNIRAIYVHGKDASLRQGEGSRVVAYMDTKRNSYSEPWGSTFNALTEMTIGLPISAIVDATSRAQIQLDDAMIASLPRCEGRIKVNCRTR